MTKRLIVCSGSIEDRTDSDRPAFWREADHLDPYVDGKIRLDLTTRLLIPKHFHNRYNAILLEYCPFEVYVHIDLTYRNKQSLKLNTTFWKNIYKLVQNDGFVHVRSLNYFLKKRIFKVRHVSYAKSFAIELSKVLKGAEVEARVKGEDIIFMM